MCGICGFIDYKYNGDSGLITRMVSTMRHRGPDDNGVYLESTDYSTIGLGQSRLSIIDLSPGGHQPMIFEHLIIVLNGEIYNYREIKNELINLGHKFTSSSDTEVVLHAFLEWGNSCVSSFIGMFAFVVFDRKTNQITLFRDRAGVKPLYYYWNSDLFLFGSELKVFHQHPAFVKKININSVHQYMDFGYIPSPYCIFENTEKLNPGHILKFNVGNKSIEIAKYWDVKDSYSLPTIKISYEDAKNEIERLLISAFEYRMVADVPVGVFLSGGYDSTAVTSILQTRRAEKLKTFTIGFEEGNNEAPFAKEIANYIGTEHTEYYCTTKETQEIVPKLPFFYDEPFADSSAIPTMLVSKLARDKVNVALSADAGDEIFAGYTIYETFKNNLKLIDKIPSNLHKFSASLLKMNNLIVPDSFSGFKHKLTTLSRVLSSDKNMHQELYRSYFILNSTLRRKLFFNPGKIQNTVFDSDFSSLNDSLSIPLAIDYFMYLQNDILTKVDRATMSVSLEGREPFLDHRIIEFAAKLPFEYKFGKTQKMILKDIVYDYVPKSLMDRPKTGFTIPIYSWLQNELYYLLENFLSPAKIIQTGFFNSQFVQKLVKDFLDGRLKDPTIIWKLLQFQMWYYEWNN